MQTQTQQQGTIQLSKMECYLALTALQQFNNEQNKTIFQGKPKDMSLDASLAYDNLKKEQELVYDVIQKLYIQFRTLDTAESLERMFNGPVKDQQNG